VVSIFYSAIEGHDNGNKTDVQRSTHVNHAMCFTSVPRIVAVEECTLALPSINCKTKVSE